ncbi:hypothetical protein MO973_17660 [Paenibacillus sp. TRM 82003]|nr:hypothetical protein [Paenibacillus sp. TRM 82003]
MIPARSPSAADPEVTVRDVAVALRRTGEAVQGQPAGHARTGCGTLAPSR